MRDMPGISEAEWETRVKIENLTSSYENRILVLVTLMAIVILSTASLFIIYFFIPRDAYDPAKGDSPLISYQKIYYGQQITQVAAWVDKDGNSHYAKEPARFAGIDVSVLVLALLGLGIAKGSHDLYSILTDRYKRRLMSETSMASELGRSKRPW